MCMNNKVSYQNNYVFFFFTNFVSFKNYDMIPYFSSRNVAISASFRGSCRKSLEGKAST